MGVIAFRRALCIACIALGAISAAPAQDDPRATAFELEKQGRNAEAEAAWRTLAREHPTDAEPFAHIGLIEARQQHYDEAIRSYRKAAALNPAMPGLQLNMGLAYFKNGDYREAIRIFDPLLKQQPADSPETQRLAVLIGMSHYGLGEYAAAAPFLKQASEHDATNLPLLLDLAHSCLLSHQYPCVLDAFHRMVALNANSAEADMLVGEALDAMKDPAGSVREFRAAIEADPKEPDVHFGLGYLLWTQKQYAEAAQEFQAELANTPGHAKSLLYLADSEIQLNRMDEAGAILEKLVKSEPANEMARLDLGIVYSETGRRTEALRELKIAAGLKPGDVDVHWRLGRLYRTMGNDAEARREFGIASSLNKAADEALIDVLTRESKNSATGDGAAPAPQPK